MKGKERDGIPKSIKSRAPRIRRLLTPSGTKSGGPESNTGYQRSGFQMRKQRDACAVERHLDGGEGGIIVGFADDACAPPAQKK